MSHNNTAQNLVEKIVQKFAVDLPEGHTVRAGDYVSIRPAHILTHDNTGAVIPKFKTIGATKMANPRQPVYALDHNIQDTGEVNIAKYAMIESFAGEMGVDFYPAGRGIGHQIMCEEGYVWPGTMVVASDSHSNMYGGLGCLGTPVVRTDAAAIWATGRTWWQVPPVVRCELTGKLREGVTGKDVIITLCGLFNNNEVLNHAVEFVGDGVSSLSIDERLTITNMTTEWGALVGLFPIDEIVTDWLRRRIETVEQRGLAGVPSDIDSNGSHPRLNRQRLAQLEQSPLKADGSAIYTREITLDLSTVTPHVAGPDNVKTMTSVTEMTKQKLKVHKAYLVSCVNSRARDIAEAARVVKGHTVADGVEFYIAAASSEVQAVAEANGDWATLLKAGALPLPPGCGPCIGLGKGLLGENEVGISATNRNFKGRMGARSAQAYLASPAVVAASAIAGHITGPKGFDTIETVRSFKEIAPQSGSDKATVAIVDGFPEKVTGRIIFCHQDNLNTDGIYPGKYTYIDDFTPEQQAEVLMENYDPEFTKLAEKGDIVVGGFTFGSGSSREQAATAFKYRGIAMVIAGSFSQTYKRNAINNGFLVIECPELVNELRSTYGTDKLTVVTDLTATIDFASSTITAGDKVYDIAPLGSAAQELVVTDGLENWVKGRL
ncbi:MAG: homoaconitase [candidate division Zixibacteria bacterium]|nr:homoaconitase [candidate division Zixibacteria bacterium]